MRYGSIMAALAASFALAACGGGGSAGGSTTGGAVIPSPVIPSPGVPSGGTQATPTPMPTAAPIVTPTPMVTPTPVMPASTAIILGSAGFVSPNGFTLYMFGADTMNVSNCNDACAQIWPPFKAKSGAQSAGGFTVITRADGSKQWAFNGHALYNFSGDAKPGDANGDGLNLNGGIWHVARP